VPLRETGSRASWAGRSHGRTRTAGHSEAAREAEEQMRMLRTDGGGDSTGEVTIRRKLWLGDRRKGRDLPS
jgi:hypothetical protein